MTCPGGQNNTKQDRFMQLPSVSTQQDSFYLSQPHTIGSREDWMSHSCHIKEVAAASLYGDVTRPTLLCRQLDTQVYGPHGLATTDDEGHNLDISYLEQGRRCACYSWAYWWTLHRDALMRSKGYRAELLA